MDVISPTLIMAQGIGRWGNFMNQEAFGAITSRAALISQHLPMWIINQMDIEIIIAYRLSYMSRYGILLALLY